MRVDALICDDESHTPLVRLTVKKGRHIDMHPSKARELGRQLIEGAEAADLHAAIADNMRSNGIEFRVIAASLTNVMNRFEVRKNKKN